MCIEKVQEEWTSALSGDLETWRKCVPKRPSFREKSFKQPLLPAAAPTLALNDLDLGSAWYTKMCTGQGI